MNFADEKHGADGRCSMDFRPVEAIGAVRPVDVKRPEVDVTPPFAIDGTGRMEEDSYRAGGNQQDRGLESEEPEELEEEKLLDSLGGAETKVNLLA